MTRAALPLLVATALALFTGCESVDKKPIDEPLTPGDAMDYDARSRQTADDLLRERRDQDP